MEDRNLVDRSQLLLRAASRLNGADTDDDRTALLTWASELLVQAAANSSRPEIGKGAREGEKDGIPIHRHYKGRMYHAYLLGDHQVRLDGRSFSTPSAAAMWITDNNVNGWRWWKHRPSDGSPDVLIDALRATGAQR